MDSDEWVNAISSSANWSEVAKQAIAECPSIDVWCKYAELLTREDCDHGPEQSSAPAVSAILSTLEDGLKQVGLWLDSSHRFWAFYIDVVERQKSSKAIVETYLARLGVPHIAIDATYTALSTYISGKGEYEETMILASKTVAKTRRLLVERERWELTKPVPLEAYLGWELERHSPNARYDFCVPLFERILTAKPRFSSLMWARFVRHMWFYHPALAESTVERALVYFPQDRVLWTLRLRIVCSQDDRDCVLTTVKDAKQAGIDLEKVPTLLNTYSAWLVNSAETLPKVARELRLLLEPIIFSPFADISQLSILTGILANAGEIEIARKAWRKRAVTTLQDSEFWESWVTFELSLDRSERVQGLMKLWKLYIHYCRLGDHPFVRRNVHRELLLNSALIEVQKIELGGDTTVWVTRIPSDWDETSIRTQMQVFGRIVDIRWPPNRGFCYVQYETYDAAFKAETVGVEGLHIEISDKSQKARPPKAHKRPRSPDDQHKSLKQELDEKKTLNFTGMQDSNDVDNVRRLIAEFRGTEIEGNDSKRSALMLRANFVLDADTGRAQLTLNGILLPSGANLKVAYA